MTHRKLRGRDGERRDSGGAKRLRTTAKERLKTLPGRALRPPRLQDGVESLDTLITDARHLLDHQRNREAAFAAKRSY